jgi:uncharacterized protein
LQNWSQKTSANRAASLRIYVGALAFGLFLSIIAVSCRAQPKVTIETAKGQISFHVEIAATPEKREVGLMYRRELPPNRGMLFIFPAEKVNSFWMKNTPIPLDMIFISRERKIVGIVHETVPFSLDGRSVSVPSQYVLEINGGLSHRYGFKAGDLVRFDNVTPERVRE